MMVPCGTLGSPTFVMTAPPLARCTDARSLTLRTPIAPRAISPTLTPCGIRIDIADVPSASVVEPSVSTPLVERPPHASIATQMANHNRAIQVADFTRPSSEPTTVGLRHAFGERNRSLLTAIQLLHSLLFDAGLVGPAGTAAVAATPGGLGVAPLTRGRGPVAFADIGQFGVATVVIPPEARISTQSSSLKRL